MMNVRLHFIASILTLFMFCTELTDPSTAFVRAQVIEKGTPQSAVQADDAPSMEQNRLPCMAAQTEDAGSKRNSAQNVSISHVAAPAGLWFDLTPIPHVGTITQHVRLLKSFEYTLIFHPPIPLARVS